MKRLTSSISRIILVASGKGGVGKSTVALNLAVLLAQRFKVGLVDADFYGPSLSFMLGADPKTKITMTEGGTLLPLEKFGLKYVSIGAMVESDMPIVWRGPMLSKMIRTFLTNAEWGELDYLIVDMPPGTGDIHITLCGDFHVGGAVLVTTAQKVSIMDVSRTYGMFKNLGVQVLGIIENMSYMDSMEGQKYIVGSEQNVSECARSLSVSVLGRIPFVSQISHSCDSSIPAVLDTGIAAIYAPILEEILMKYPEITQDDPSLSKL